MTMSFQGYRDELHAKDSRVIKETIYTPNRLINAVSILSTGPIFLFALLGTAAHVAQERSEARALDTLDDDAVVCGRVRVLLGQDALSYSGGTLPHYSERVWYPCNLRDDRYAF